MNKIFMDKKQRDKFKLQVGLEVRTIREKLGITQVQLGDSLGLESAYISKIERGVKPLPLLSLFELLSICDEESSNQFIINMIKKVKGKRQ
ncbi:helix-turn-helix domain-containing protein [Shewanella sp. M-Br]|uniref:helix-turn-helix domain-containing protein n=1 Tax=Shewanella sp. M-Br TaxID=2495595 RepID=UPI002948FD73|nr:hypothetical protein SMBr_29980 [Shewanella sp. M-Br]